MGKKSQGKTAQTAVAAVKTSAPVVPPVSRPAPVARGVQYTQVGPRTVNTAMAPAAPVTAAAPAPAKKGQGAKTQFMLAAIAAAGAAGITWAQLQGMLRAKFGSAPKKRRTLYLALSGVAHYRQTHANGVKTYHLGTAPAQAPAS
jgi:hypothetical protein